MMSSILLAVAIYFHFSLGLSFKSNQHRCTILNRHTPIACQGHKNNVDAHADKRLSSYIVSGVLLASFVSNQWSRQAIYYLCDFSSSSTAFQHMNVALAFTKDSYATLSSVGFTLIFAAFSVLAGISADKFNRPHIIVITGLIWSAATALHATAYSFFDVAVLRAIVGASQAFFNPAAFTLIADTYSPQLVGRMNSVLSSGIYLGGGLASLSVLLDAQLGWRDTMLAIGAFGAVCAAVTLFLIKEPREQVFLPNSAEVSLPLSTQSTRFQSSPGEIVAGLKEVLSPRLSQLLLSASTLRFGAGFAIVAWKAPFIFAKFPHSEAAFAGGNALIVSLGGVASTLLGGYLSDALANPSDKSKRPISRCWVAAVGSFLAAPCWAGFLLSNSPEQAALFLLLEYLTAECWFGPTLAALFNTVPLRRRGVAQGVFSVLTALGTLGPLAVGSLSDLKMFTAPTTPAIQAVVRMIIGNSADAALILNSGVSTVTDSATINLGAVGTVLLSVVCGAYLLSSLLFTVAALEEDKMSSV